MARRLDGNVAIITGGSRGIGQAISVALAAEGATVVLAARSVDRLGEAAELIRRSGGRAETVVTELTQEDSIRHLVRTTQEKFGRLDILINNAGVTYSAMLDETRTVDREALGTRIHLAIPRSTMEE